MGQSHRLRTLLGRQQNSAKHRYKKYRGRGSILSSPSQQRFQTEHFIIKLIRRAFQFRTFHDFSNSTQLCIRIIRDFVSNIHARVSFKFCLNYHLQVNARGAVVGSDQTQRRSVQCAGDFGESQRGDLETTWG